MSAGANLLCCHYLVTFYDRCKDCRFRQMIAFLRFRVIFLADGHGAWSSEGGRVDLVDEHAWFFVCGVMSRCGLQARSTAVK
jgi:hypothetical protein